MREEEGGLGRVLLALSVVAVAVLVLAVVIVMAMVLVVAVVECGRDCRSLRGCRWLPFRRALVDSTGSGGVEAGDCSRSRRPTLGTASRSAVPKPICGRQWIDDGCATSPTSGARRQHRLR